MNRQFERYLQSTLVILDLAVLNITFFLAWIIFFKKLGEDITTNYLKYLLICNAVWMLLSVFFRGYTRKGILNFEYFTKRTIQIYSAWIIVVLFYLFFSREFTISRLFVISTLGSFSIGLMVNRFLYLGIKSYFRKSHSLTKKVLILGYNDTAKQLARYFEEDGINTQLVGFIENNKNIHELSHYPVLGNVEDSLQIAQQMEVEEIFSTITPEQNKFIYDLMYKAERACIRFKIVPNLSLFITRDVHIEYFNDLPVMSLRSEPLEDVGNKIKKRILDVVISVFVIVFVLSWMVPLFALLIFLETGESVFFRQQRTGRNNKPFSCIKFRSMKTNKDADKKQATRDDERITRIGHFIRKTSLDEFPQFFNVLKGEMSLVGPRPHMLKHTSDYSKIVDEYMIRQFLKPGITGWAQVHGFRGEITNPEQIKKRVDKDLWYLENWSLWLDIRILFMTVYTLIVGDKNAY